MKKLLKSFLVVVVAVCVAMPLVVCKKKVSPTTANTDNIKTVAGVNTNGGMTVVNGEYLYFINGSKTNDGTSSKDNTRGAICRVKYNTETGETSGDMEVVVDELAGFANGSISIFGDYLYYTTPCSDKNSSATVLYNKTVFKRYDLVNEKSYTIYTTELNSSSESIKFAYYVVGDSLNLVVYEQSNATIKSFKIGEDVTLNYEITEVVDCVLSETNGKLNSSDVTVDANSFVFYSIAPGTGEYPNSGYKVYKTSPVTNNSVKISEGKEISFVTIRAGKLVYSYDEKVFASEITSGAQTISTEFTSCISYKIYENAIYLENYKLIKGEGSSKLVKSNGDIVMLVIEEDVPSFSLLYRAASSNEPIVEQVANLGDDEYKDFEFAGFGLVEEIITEKDETNNIEEEKGTFLNVFFKNSSKLYKLAIAEVSEDNSDELSVCKYASKFQITGSTLSTTNGILTPEAIGNYLFILVQDSDKNNYLTKIDLSNRDPNTEETDLFQIKE